MKFVQYFDGHIVINLFGILIRIKKSGKPRNIILNESGITEIKRDEKIIAIPYLLHALAIACQTTNVLKLSNLKN